MGKKEMRSLGIITLTPASILEEQRKRLQKTTDNLSGVRKEMIIIKQVK